MVWRLDVCGAACCGLLSACASGPAVDPITALANAEGHLARGEVATAVDLLDPLDEEQFTGVDLEKFLIRKGQALARYGELWDAYQTIKDFADDHAFSRYKGEVEDLEYGIGNRLIQSSGGFLFFTSDEADGQIVLEHFTVRYPKHRAAPDALRLLGEKAYREGDYLVARERYRELLISHSDSEWIPLARFRVAMASFHELTGPEYDIQSMSSTEQELADFLTTDVENPRFRTEAEDALATVRRWLAQKHISIANFYRTLGNTKGELTHLRLAVRDYPDTPAGKQAERRLPKLEAKIEAIERAIEGESQ